MKYALIAVVVLVVIIGGFALMQSGSHTEDVVSKHQQEKDIQLSEENVVSSEPEPVEIDASLLKSGDEALKLCRSYQDNVDAKMARLQKEDMQKALNMVGQQVVLRTTCDALEKACSENSKGFDAQDCSKAVVSFEQDKKSWENLGK